MTLVLTSPAFAEGDRIPLKFTRNGGNLFPPLHWSGAPKGVKSYMLEVDDPDAPGGTFRHCTILDIPADADGLPEGVDASPDHKGLKYARNDFGGAGYDGPQPPPGHGVHHYHFRLAALDVEHLDVPPGAQPDRLVRAARPHVIERAELVATYER